MKRKNLLISSALVAGIMAAGFNAQPVNAQSYTDAINGTGDGSISFSGDDDSQVPNPTDPDTPVKPVNPNTNDGDLKLVYVPDFAFGSHKKSVAGITAYAQMIDLADPATKSVPFVTTKDMRTERGKGWALTVNASTFKDASNHEIKGAVVSLEGAKYTAATATSPKVASNSIALEPNTSVTVASADASSTVADGNQGIGMYSLALGTEQSDGTTDGVKFTLPKSTAVNDGQYTATFQWTLAPVL